MSLYLSDHEKQAIATIDESEFREVINGALIKESLIDLDQLQTSDYGPYITSKLSSFCKALSEYCKSKSAKKRERTYFYAYRAGSDLASAVSSMKRRVEEEERERQLFRIDDRIPWPPRFSENMQVRVFYQWRQSDEDRWTHRSIVFRHQVILRTDYTRPQSKRKPSAAKQAQSLQEELSQTWEHFMQVALYSVRDFFREGGDGREIPDSFQARRDENSLRLNNHSLKFWQENL